MLEAINLEKFMTITVRETEVVETDKNGNKFSVKVWGIFGDKYNLIDYSRHSYYAYEVMKKILEIKFKGHLADGELRIDKITD